MSDTKTFGTYSSARVANGIVFTSGKVGVDDQGMRHSAFRDEVHAALVDLEKTLIEHGASLESLLQVQCILSDMNNFAEFDQVYAEFMPENVPPRFTHGADLVQDFRIEVVGIAAVTTS